MASPLDLDELLLNVLARLPEYEVTLGGGAIHLTSRLTLVNAFSPAFTGPHYLRCPLLEELVLMGDSTSSRQALAASIRSSLPRLRRIEMQMDEVHVEVLKACAARNLERVQLCFLNLPQTEDEWAALRALGPRACLDVDLLMDQVEAEDLIQPESWLPPGLLELDSGAEVTLDVHGVLPRPWAKIALRGLDSVPGLRSLSLTCSRWHRPGFPTQLWHCSQLTQLAFSHARLYPPHVPAGAFSQLGALQRLQLRNCSFGPAGQLPEDMCSLSQLTGLYITRRGQHRPSDSGDPGFHQIPPFRPLALPPSVSQLRSLQQLPLEGWRLSGLEAVCATALTELSLAGSLVPGDAALPWLAGLQALHAPRIAPSLGSIAASASRVRGLALRDSADVLEQGWPALEERVKRMLWLEVLVVCVEGPEGSAGRLRPWLQQRLAAAGLPLSLFVRGAGSSADPPPPFQLDHSSLVGGKYSSYDPEPDGSDDENAGGSDNDSDSEGMPEDSGSGSEGEGAIDDIGSDSDNSGE